MTSNFYNLFCTAIYLSLIVLVGYTALCAAVGSGVRHWAHVLGISFAAGAGIVPLILFAVSIAGAKPGRWILVVTAIIAVMTLIYLRRKKSLVKISVPSPWQKANVWAPLGIVALLVIVASVGNAATYAGWPGLNDMDVFAIWLFKAKWVALSALRPIPAVFFDPTLSYSHQDYPLSLPFLVAGLYAVIGSVDESAAKLLCVPIYLALIAIVYGAIRRLHPRSIALAITAVFASSPTLCQNAGLLVAETSLLLALMAMATSLLRWMESGQRGDLILAGLFAAIAAFTKNEGLAMVPFVAVIAFAVAVVRRKSRDWLIAAVVCAAAIGPWLIYRTYLPKTHEDYGGKLTKVSTLAQNLGRLDQIKREFLARAFDGPRAGLIWYSLIVVALMGWRGFARTPALVLWILLVIQLTLYVGTFVVTPWDLSLLIRTIGPKLLTQATPLAVLLIAVHLREIRGVGSDKSAVMAC